jgi:hypothetical protein
MEKRIQRIKYKLELLRQSDEKHSLFGSDRHMYLLHPPISERAIKEFEKSYGIILPEEFAKFYSMIGNGGAGPYYGLEPLYDTIYCDLHYKRKGDYLNPSEPFPHTDSWNMTFQPTVSAEEEEEYYKQLTAFEKQYFDPQHRNGAIAVCYFGCGVSINLIVNGHEYGYMWSDDRGSDGGIFPSRELGNSDKISFLDWYELWLDQSLRQFISAEQLKLLEEIRLPSLHAVVTKDEAERKPWWRFW